MIKVDGLFLARQERHLSSACLIQTLCGKWLFLLGHLYWGLHSVAPERHCFCFPLCHFHDALDFLQSFRLYSKGFKATVINRPRDIRRVLIPSGQSSVCLRVCLCFKTAWLGSALGQCSQFTLSEQ